MKLKNLETGDTFKWSGRTWIKSDAPGRSRGMDQTKCVRIDDGWRIDFHPDTVCEKVDTTIRVRPGKLCLLGELVPGDLFEWHNAPRLLTDKRVNGCLIALDMGGGTGQLNCATKVTKLEKL